ncbi:hypothetical protein [Wolbachia endosymbiont (group A) of Acrocera orbiculus]|uniref:hypothetical protein n=1 Tax=Wolbachia endosymbiont (group A) of Acrocera orbiculus TaxID=2953971 RepID=UPI002225C28C|nr:hypothetical protein [Wolbachia endosymbiont (group A) of Acrocera orbiculus]
MENWIPVSATRMTSSFFWDSSVTRWNDTFRINIKKFTKRRKRQKKPRGWLIIALSIKVRM